MHLRGMQTGGRGVLQSERHRKACTYSNRAWAGRAERAGDSDRLITGSADQSIRIWDLPTGKEQFRFIHREPCRSVRLSSGERFLAATSDAFMESPPSIHIYNFAENSSEQSATPVMTWAAPKGRVTRVLWTDCNRQLVTSHDYGFVRRWDVEVGAREGSGGKGRA